MRVIKVDLRHYRGFDSLTIFPQQHVCLVGEPGAGRSDLMDALIRVLSPDFTRSRLPNELDFYQRDITKRAEVEVVLGDLGEELEQVFFDHLELWERDKNVLVDELVDPQLIDRDIYNIIVRLCYRATWTPEEDRAEHWVDYPKNSDPDAGLINRVSSSNRRAIKFSWVQGKAQVLEEDAATAYARDVARLERYVLRWWHVRQPLESGSGSALAGAFPSRAVKSKNPQPPSKRELSRTEASSSVVSLDCQMRTVPSGYVPVTVYW